MPTGPSPALAAAAKAAHQTLGTIKFDRSSPRAVASTSFVAATQVSYDCSNDVHEPSSYRALMALPTTRMNDSLHRSGDLDREDGLAEPAREVAIEVALVAADPGNVAVGA